MYWGFRETFFLVEDEVVILCRFGFLVSRKIIGIGVLGRFLVRFNKFLEGNLNNCF